jgi:quinol monooxygenase YgiN
MKSSVAINITDDRQISGTLALLRTPHPLPRMIHVIATISLTPGTRTEFLAAFHKLVPLVKAENGCLSYGPVIDAPSGLPIQSLIGGDAVVVVEQWRDLPALHAHLAAPHIAAFQRDHAALMRGISLQVLAPA